MAQSFQVIPNHPGVFMNKQANRVLASIGFVLCLTVVPAPAFAQEGTTSTTTTVETRGVGFKGANVFNPKYKERIATYKEQIQMGANKGWLTPADVETFTKRLNELTELEAAVAAKGWQKADVDDIDKQFTKFNMDFSNAGNKSTPPPAASTAVDSEDSPPAAKPAGTVSDGSTKSTAKTTTKKTITRKRVKAKPRAK